MFGRKQRDLMPAPPEYGPSVPKPFSELLPQGQESALGRLARTARIPDDARALVRALDTETTLTLQFLAHDSAAVRDVYEVEQIRDEHTLAVVESYVSVPGAEKAALPDGRSLAAVLVANLTTLLEATREVQRRTAERGEQQMQVNDMFLRDKFGSGDDSLRLPPTD
ncbi:hypothetical protein [Flexivirga caeni]|uniref:Uncharacterized protein n=1 Tax=Flexivirga caeni TaxID=2294115 RepID=A0A3M9M311_9MICO|nr:hypothetical protein [Flexivirga caeni]RNI19525.1 hypothetical protein EFY87_16985 [Flexivirga caeni]